MEGTEISERKQEMEMKVQEYLMEEQADILWNNENLDEWNKLVDELNLEGQRQITGNGRNPFPFPCMNRGVERVFEVLCPTKCLVKDYNKTTIPLRVLMLIGLCAKNEYFGKIEIWYDETEIDPVVVGCDGQDKYLIARWGDEIEEMGVLQEKAIKRKVQERTMRLQKEIKEKEMSLQTVVEDVTEYVIGKSAYLF